MGWGWRGNASFVEKTLAKRFFFVGSWPVVSFVPRQLVNLLEAPHVYWVSMSIVRRRQTADDARHALHLLLDTPYTQDCLLSVHSLTKLVCESTPQIEGKA